MTSRSIRRTLLSVEALEDRVVLSSTAVLPMAAPPQPEARTRGHHRPHHGPRQGHHHRHHHRHHVVQVPQGTPPQQPNLPPASFFDVFADFSGVANNSRPGDADRDKAELARKDAAGWRDSAACDHDPVRRAQKLNAAGDADKAADDWDKAADARDKGDNDKADKLEQAAQQRENAAREWGANGDGAAAQKAEQAAQDLEKKAQ